MKKNHFDIAVIGGGASGMMACIAIKMRQPKKTVVLLERNQEPGRKLLASGNGRCNFTNLFASPKDYAESQWFTALVMNRWNPQKIMELLEQLGVMYRIEDEGRVYPYSGRGASVVEALRRSLARLGVNSLCNAEVKEVNRKETEKTKAEKDGYFQIELSGGDSLFCQRLILATGGKAGSQYGCLGDGYRFAQKLGHGLTRVRPALVAVNCRGWNPKWKGVRSQAKVSLKKSSPQTEGGWLTVAEQKGEVQFTDFGLSGICVLNLSRHIVYTKTMKEGRGEVYELEVDFLPEYSRAQVFALLKDRCERLKNAASEELLLSVVHERIIEALLFQAGISKELKSAGQAHLKRLSGLLKGWRFEVEGTRGFRDAQVTAGGVMLNQVREDTMESKIQPGLYLCGELLDVDGRCGGYNLQWAFASGYAAGYHAAGG